MHTALYISATTSTLAASHMRDVILILITKLNIHKLAPCGTVGLTVDSSRLTFLPSSKSRDTKTRINTKNPA